MPAPEVVRPRQSSLVGTSLIAATVAATIAVVAERWRRALGFPAVLTRPENRASAIVGQPAEQRGQPENCCYSAGRSCVAVADDFRLTDCSPRNWAKRHCRSYRCCCCDETRP